MYISDALRAQIQAADEGLCRYCLTSVMNSGMPLCHDHIQPVSKGGGTTFENVCLACRACNEFKADLTEAEDPLIGTLAPLFNPREQAWRSHFAWSADGTLIEGLTPTGRATVIALRMNAPTIMAARRRWVMVGWHPPGEHADG